MSTSEKAVPLVNPDMGNTFTGSSPSEQHGPTASPGVQPVPVDRQATHPKHTNCVDFSLWWEGVQPPMVHVPRHPRTRSPSVQFWTIPDTVFFSEPGDGLTLSLSGIILVTSMMPFSIDQGL